jgi:hypothetical protein
MEGIDQPGLIALSLEEVAQVLPVMTAGLKRQPHLMILGLEGAQAAQQPLETLPVIGDGQRTAPLLACGQETDLMPLLAGVNPHVNPHG